MAFCGRCGLLQPPNVIYCPRCGFAVTPDEASTGHNADNPTIVSVSDKTEQSGGPSTSQPGLGQEPNRFVGYGSQPQRAEQGVNTPFPGYYGQNAMPVPPPPSYASHSDSGPSTTQEGPYSSGYVPGAVFPTDRAQQTKNRGTLLVVLLVLFLGGAIVGATTAVFAIGPERVLQIVSGSGSTAQSTVIAPTSPASTPPPQVATPTPVPPTPTSTLTPEQQGKSVVDRYYTSINNKDYQTAYNLWVNYTQSYQDFANGFADTLHDDYQFGQVLRQADGTVQVDVTLVATSTSYQRTTYQGYYVVGQQSDGSWKIVTASMSQV
jgi:hypothetical protein